MGCMCCSLASFVSIVLHALERISLCTVCAMLTCCLLFTIMSVLMLGIGIGYHYCFVQNSVEAMSKAAKAAGSMRSGPESGPLGGGVLRSLDKVAKRGFARRVARRDADPDPPLTNHYATDNSTQQRTERYEPKQLPPEQIPFKNTSALSMQSLTNSMKHRIVRREVNSYPPLFKENTTDISTTNVTNFSRLNVTLRETSPFSPLPNLNIDLSFKNLTVFSGSDKESLVWRAREPNPIIPLSDQNATIISFNKIISNMTNFTIFA